MLKINKLAVIFCGEFRTWKRAAPYLFRFCDTLSDNIDYYFTTWNITNEISELSGKFSISNKKVTEQDVTIPFDNRNLVDYRILDFPKQLRKFNTTFYYQAYLAKVANILKNKHEFKNNFLYDAVIETRPDFYLGKGIKPQQDNYIQLEEFNYVNGNIFKIDNSYPQCSDVYYRSSSFCNDIISNRFFRYNPKFYKHLENSVFINNHWLLLDYLQSRRLNALSELTNELSLQIPIRSYHLEFDFDNLSQEEFQSLRDYDRKYKNNNQ